MVFSHRNLGLPDILLESLDPTVVHKHIPFSRDQQPWWWVVWFPDFRPLSCRASPRLGPEPPVLGHQTVLSQPSLEVKSP